MTSNLREPSQQHAVVSANFADYRLVKTRSALQLIFEIAIERQAAVFAALGFPMPGEEISCAIVRLNPGAGAKPERTAVRNDGALPRVEGAPLSPMSGREAMRDGRTVGSIPATGASDPASTQDVSEAPRPVPLDRRPAGEMSRSEQGKARYAEASDQRKAVTRAALLAQDERFQEWAIDGFGCGSGESGAAEFIRVYCGVSSRGDIETNDQAYRRFLKLEETYKFTTGQMAEPR